MVQIGPLPIFARSGTIPVGLQGTVTLLKCICSGTQAGSMARVGSSSSMAVGAHYQLGGLVQEVTQNRGWLSHTQGPTPPETASTDLTSIKHAPH